MTTTTPDGPAPFDPALPFAGLSVLVTGTLPNLSRPDAQDRITALGGKPVGSVSGATGLVVLGDGAGVSKMVKIRRHDLPVLSGADFEELLASPATHPAVLAAAAAGVLGTPCSTWEAGAAPTDDVDPDAHPGDELAWSERHLVGQASAPPTGGGPGMEYRMWCVKCGAKWLGQKGPDSIYAGCPNDPTKKAA